MSLIFLLDDPVGKRGIGAVPYLRRHKDKARLSWVHRTWRLGSCSVVSVGFFVIAGACAEFPNGLAFRQKLLVAVGRNCCEPPIIARNLGTVSGGEPKCRNTGGRCPHQFCDDFRKSYSRINSFCPGDEMPCFNPFHGIDSPCLNSIVQRTTRKLLSISLMIWGTWSVRL